MGKDIKDIQIIDKFPQGILKGPKILLNHDLINTIMSTAGIFSSKKNTIKKRKIQSRASTTKRRGRKNKLLVDLPKKRQLQMDVENYKKIKAIENGTYVSTLKPFQAELMSTDQKVRIIKKIKSKLCHGEEIDLLSKSFNWEIQFGKILENFSTRNSVQRMLFKTMSLGIERELVELERFIVDPDAFLDELECSKSVRGIKA